MQALADPELDAALAAVGQDRRAAERSEERVGPSTSAGARFRVLRMHTRGGLGEISIAEDTERNRQVALNGRGDTAIVIYQKVYALTKEIQGEDHEDTLMSMSNLAVAYQEAKQLDKALPLLQRTYEVRRRLLGEQHPEAWLMMRKLAASCFAADQLDEALSLVTTLLDNLVQTRPEDATSVLVLAGKVAMAVVKGGRAPAAVPVLEKLVTELKRTVGSIMPLLQVGYGNWRSSISRWASRRRHFVRCWNSSPLSASALLHIAPVWRTF